MQWRLHAGEGLVVAGVQEHGEGGEGGGRAPHRLHPGGRGRGEAVDVDVPAREAKRWQND